MALKEIIGFPTALYYILFRALNFNFSANKFFLENKSMDTSTIFKSNHSALSYFKQGEGNFHPGASSVSFPMTYMLCLFNGCFHICYVCSMMHCFCRQIKQWRIDDGRQISICIGGVSAIAIVHITNAIYLQLTLSKYTIAKSTIATVYPTNLMCRQ